MHNGQRGLLDPAAMGGPSLEVFKFGMYVFVPVAAMWYFSRPEFSEVEVKKTPFYPAPESLGPRPPANAEEVEEAFRRLRARRAAARDGPPAPPS